MTMAKEPMRKCVGCGKSFPKSQLIRIAYKAGVINAIDDINAQGRGAYICKNSGCLKKAVKKKAFARVIRGEVKAEQIEELTEVVSKYEKSE